MITKKILIVSRFFYPVNNPRAFRTTELAKELARQGHKVTVITPRDKDHASFERKYGMTIKDLGQPKWKKVELKGSGVAALFRRALRRFPDLLLEYPDIELMGMVKRALKGECGYDMLISIAVPYPIHWGVAAVRNGEEPIAKTWVADCGDPYYGQENDSFKTPFYFAWVEKWFCKKVDYLTVPTEGSKQGYFPEFRDKIKVIPQGFRFEDVKMKKVDKGRTFPEFAYAGTFIPGRRDPSELLTYLLQKEEDFRFHIYTGTRSLVEPFVALSKGRIVLHDPIPRDQLLYELSGMDFMVNFDNIGGKQTPSKLIDYVIIKKPIISIKTGNLDEEAVDQFLAGRYEKEYVVPQPERYRIENVAKQFLDLAQ